LSAGGVVPDWLKVFLGCALPLLVLLADRRGDDRHKQALADTLAAADVDTTPWYDRDPVRTAMSANRLGAAVKMWPVWALLAVFGLITFRLSVPGCCAGAASWLAFPVYDFPAGPLPWLAFVSYVTGLGGVVICPLMIVSRLWERRAARKLRPLAATPASTVPMWLTLFRKSEQSYAEWGGWYTVTSNWAVLWPTMPTLDITTLPSDPIHRQAVAVKLVHRHELDCPDNLWSSPELVTVLGEPLPGKWVVIRAAGATYWPTKRVKSNTTWRRLHRYAYKISHGKTQAQPKQPAPRKKARS
jgi:hypothetical protein